MKEEMIRNGWILPTLEANMRNQVNITNVKIKMGEAPWKIKIGAQRQICEMQSSIKKLASGTSLIGDIPIDFKLRDSDWKDKKDGVLKHCIELMSQKSEKNIVVLWDLRVFEDVADDIKRVIKDKKVVAYPSKQSKDEGISNIKQFVEKSDHILVTESRYFNGCESANVIILTSTMVGKRNSVLRGVQNIMCVRLVSRKYGRNDRMNGMKEDNRFFKDF